MCYRSLTLAACLLVITVAAYSTAIGGGFIWDDGDYVTENLMIRSFAGLRAIWLDPSATPQYYPLVHSSFWIEYQLWGLWPAGYHLVNVLLHVVNSLLLWRLLVRFRVPAAWLAALVFAVHPVHVESVAWITERKNVLSGCFYLTSLLCFLRFWDFTKEDLTSQHKLRGWYFVALLFFLFAMWSKTVAATLPAAICVLVWWQRGRISPRVLAVLAPMFLIGIGLGLLTVWLEKHHVGAKGIDWQLSLVDRCLIAGRAIVFYACKLVWPANLTFIYPRWQIDATVLWQYAFPSLVIAVIAALWGLRKRIGRGPLAAVLFFTGTLFPALGFFDVYPMRFSFVADHFQYVASIGVIVLVVVSASVAANRIFPSSPGLPQISAGLIVGTLVVITWQQGKIYEGLEVLWRDTLYKNPNAFLAHNNLGALLNDRGDYEEAEEYLVQAVRIKPDFVDSVVNLAKTREGLGDLAQAEVLYQQATGIDANFAPAFNGLGAVYGMTGRAELSEKNLRRALELDPRHARAHSNLATLFGVTGRTDESIREFDVALRLDPTLTDTRANFARVLMSQQQFDRAQSILEELVRMRPSDASALLNLGVIAGNQERHRTAIGYFERVLEFEPTNLQANYNLGAMYEMIGEPEKSQFYFRNYDRLSGPPPSP